MKQLFKTIGDIDIPAHYEVCWRCEGTGSHTNPAVDGNGITASEVDELGPDFMEAYLAGRYDIQCLECNGERLILEPNEWDTLTEIEQEALDAQASYEMERAAEIKMGY